MSAGIIGGNVKSLGVLSANIAPAATAANTTAEQTFTVRGLLVTDFVFVNKPTAQAGLAIGNVRVSAADTLAIVFINDTAGSLTATTENYLILVARAEGTQPAGFNPS
jgi:hypothetical protein